MPRIIVVKDHAIRRLRTRFGIWVDEPNPIIAEHVKLLLQQGIVVGAQLHPGIAYQVLLPSGVTAYLMGEQEPERIVIITALTLEQYVGNMRAAGLRDPARQPKKHKFSRRTRRSDERKLKARKPWKFPEE